MALAFDTSGRQLATTSDDNTARVWNLGSESGDERRFDLASPGRAVVFAADGQRLTTVTLNGTVGTWSLGSDIVKEACTRLPRNPTRDEWKLQVGDIPYREVCPGLR